MLDVSGSYSRSARSFQVEVSRFGPVSRVGRFGPILVMSRFGLIYLVWY